MRGVLILFLKAVFLVGWMYSHMDAVTPHKDVDYLYDFVAVIFVLAWKPQNRAK